MTNSKAPWLTRGGAIALMAAAAIALAACSGGGGLNEDEAAGLQQELKEARAQATLDAAARMTAETEAALAQTAKETAEAEATVARTAQVAAETAKKLAEEIADGQVSDAEAAVETAQKAAKDALEAKAKADAALIEARAKQKEAEVERDAAVRAEATARQQLQAERQVATTEKQRRQEAERQAEQQQEQLQQELTEAEQEALNARASAYLAAITDGGTARTDVTVTYLRGDTLRINPDGNFETGSGAPAISGFTARTYTREVGVTADQTLYHYTNIQAPGTRAFWKLHGLGVGAAHDDTEQNATPTGTARVVRVVGQTLDYAEVDTYNIAVSGTYDGVSGTYTCTTCPIMDSTGDSQLTAADFDADVFVMLGDEGRSFVTGTWDFKPGSITSGVRQTEDPEYLYFGIWVEEPDVASAAHEYEFFSGGSARFADVNNTSLPGTAKFSGGAVGKYVTRDQVGDNAKIGTFTAAANFTATFGGSPTLEGRLTDFRDGSQTLTGWNVYLGGADDEPTAFAGGTVSDLAGGAKASIGGVSATGNWSADLLGTLNPGRGQLTADPDAATKYPLARYPVADLAGVVGNFHATSTNAALAGAFAATRSN